MAFLCSSPPLASRAICSARTSNIFSCQKRTHLFWEQTATADDFQLHIRQTPTLCLLHSCKTATITASSLCDQPLECQKQTATTCMPVTTSHHTFATPSCPSTLQENRSDVFVIFLYAKTPTFCPGGQPHLFLQFSRVSLWHFSMPCKQLRLVHDVTGL